MEQYSTLILIALMVVAFYFLIMRPQRKRQQAIQQTMNALTPGSRVMLGSGLFGTVVSVGTEAGRAGDFARHRAHCSEAGHQPGWSPKTTRTLDDRDELDEQDEPDELQEQYPALRENAAPEEPQAFQPERPIDEPTPATTQSPSSSRIRHPPATRSLRQPSELNYLTNARNTTHVATTTGHPGRTLIVLGVLIAGLITLMAVSNTWTPKLGLDLRGGTTITLTAENTTGTGAVDPNSLQLAKTIIQSRVDSLGRGRVRGHHRR